jgi:hypothetical protein
VPSTVGIVASGEDVLNDAVFWVDAGLSSVSSGALTNLGTGGSALNAQFGSTSGTDSFDPQLLTHTGTNYLYLPGNATSYASSPSSTPLNVTGDIELEVIFHTPPDWTAAAVGNGGLIGKEALGQRSYVLRRTNAGTGLTFVWSVDGSTALSASVTTAVPAATNAIKVTHDVDNGATQNAVAFWTSTNYGATYAQLGSTQLTAGTTSHFAGTAPLTVGGSLAVAIEAAGYRRAVVRDGIGGTAVFDADFTTGITSGAQATFTESSANAATVTINRSTSGRKSVAVTRSTLLFGTDDYLEVADSDLLDFGASDSFTVMAVVRQWATVQTFNAIIAKKDDNLVTAGWAIRHDASSRANSLLGDGAVLVSNVVTASSASGVMASLMMVRDTVADTVQTFRNSTGSTATNDNTTATVANASPMRIGRYSSSTVYSDMELVAAAVWRRALNTNEIATLVARYT